MVPCYLIFLVLSPLVKPQFCPACSFSVTKRNLFSFFILLGYSKKKGMEVGKDQEV